jgi:hypothetical protein
MAAKVTKRVEAAMRDQASHRKQVEADRQIAQLRESLADSQRKYKAAIAELDAAKQRADLQTALVGMSPRKMAAKASKRAAPATAVLVLSDWHIEETVTRESVNSLNEYTLPIARRRVADVFTRAMRLIAHERQLVDIDHLVVACLGDFISGHIHDELMETCSLGPMEATREVGELLLGGLDTMLQSFRKITVVTSHGNHGRSTHKIRVATGARHSHEHNLYKWLEKTTRGTKGLEWQIADGYLNYMDVQGYTLRFQWRCRQVFFWRWRTDHTDEQGQGELGSLSAFRLGYLRSLPFVAVCAIQVFGQRLRDWHEPFRSAHSC